MPARLDIDQLLAKGAITGPHKRCRPTTRWRLFWRRFYRALIVFLLAPRADLRR